MYGNTLDGWTVHCQWDTSSAGTVDSDTNTCTWETAKDESADFIMTIAISVYNETRDYQPGEFKLYVPGIGYSLRGEEPIKVSSIGANEKDSGVYDASKQDWEYEWDEANDVYIITNTFELPVKNSKNGGLEIIWKLSSRDTINGYTQTKSPWITVNDSSLTLAPLTFSATTEKDTYQVTWEQCITGEEYGSLDSNYIWKKYTTSFQNTWKARGLEESEFYVDITLPDGLTGDDLIVMNTSGWEPTIQTLDATNRIYRVYPLQYEEYDMVGKVTTWGQNDAVAAYELVGSKSGTYKDSFFLGIKKHENANGTNELVGKTVSLNGHFNRLYYDEAGTWTTTSLDNQVKDIVDVDDAFTLSSYGFTYKGLGYSLTKWTQGYEHGTTGGNNFNNDHQPPTNYRDRLLASKLYDNTVIEFHVKSGVTKTYEGQTTSASETTSTDVPSNRVGDAQSATKVPVTTAVKGQTHSENHKPTQLGGRTETQSGVGEGGTYSMEIGDDRLTVILKDGSMRELTDDEYYFTYIDMPQKANPYYSYEIYGAKAKDNPNPIPDPVPDGEESNYAPYFDSFVCLATGNTSTRNIVSLPKGYTNVFVRINDVTGSFVYSPTFAVDFHLKEDEANPIAVEERVSNYCYQRIVYSTDEDYYEVSDGKPDGTGYNEGWSQTTLKPEDLANYGEYMYRSFSNVYLRSMVTKLSTNAEFADASGNQTEGYEATVIAEGTIEADTEGSIEKFSLYSMIPDHFQFDVDELNLTLAASGFYEDPDDGTIENEAELMADLEDFSDHVQYRTATIDGHTWLVADFDFSEDALEVSKPISLKITYPVTMSGADYLSAGTSTFNTATYLVVHDEGIKNVTEGAAGGSIVKATLDLDLTEAKDMSYDSDKMEFEREATAWSSYVTKYVKTPKSGGYVFEGAVRRQTENMSDERRAEAEYSYRLDFGLGANKAKNIWFFDALEQGAMLSANTNDQNEYRGEASEWQGDLESVDMSHAVEQSLTPEVYYLYSDTALYQFQDQPYNISSYAVKIPYDTKTQFADDACTQLVSGWVKMEDQNGDGKLWTIPEDVQTANKGKALAIAIHLDTSSHNSEGMLLQKENTYAVINMLAADADEKTAVNQYFAQYDNYSITGTSQGIDRLPSSATYVTVMDDVGKIILAKVDAVSNAILTDAVFNVYRVYESTTGDGYEFTYKVNKKNKTVLLNLDVTSADSIFTGDEAVNGKKVNAAGRIVIKDKPSGFYMYQELSVPHGYSGTADTNNWGVFYLDGNTGTIKILNKRLPTKVVLTKLDADRLQFGERVTLENATYRLYTSKGETFNIIATDTAGVYKYDDGSNRNASWVSTLTTGADGTITVYDLPWGSYRFEETKAPTGFELSTSQIRFTVNRSIDLRAEEDGTIYIPKELTVEDHEIPASVSLIKVDATNITIRIPNTYFDLQREVTNENGEVEWVTATTMDGKKIVDYRTDSNGILQVDNLYYGHYRFIEKRSATGYKMPADPEAAAVEFELTSTGDRMVYVGQENERNPGQMNIRKVSEAGGTLPGAAFQLYKKQKKEQQSRPELEGGRLEGDVVVVPIGGTSTTTDDYEYILIRFRAEGNGYVQDPNGDIDTIEVGEGGLSDTIGNLDWGDYVLREVVSPKGYVLDTTKDFEFTIDQSNASANSTITEEIENERQRGTVVLTKKDEMGNAINAENTQDQSTQYQATFQLYTTTGEKVGYDHVETGYDTEHPTKSRYVIEKDGTNTNYDYITDSDGEICVSGIAWGSYYFKETDAPDGYGVSSDYVRFSINRANAAAVQQLECIDEKVSAKIIIKKTINEYHEAYGEPTFIFLIDGQDTNGYHRQYVQSMTIGEEKEGMVEINVPAGTYTVKEKTANRYKFSTVTGTENVIAINGLTATVDLTKGTDTDPAEVEIHYENNVQLYEELSHTSAVTNMIKASRKITGFTVEYTGPAALTNEMGREYTFSEKDIKARLIYDDDIVYEEDYIPFSELTIDPESVDASYNGGRTVYVNYTKNNVTYGDSFGINIDLKNPIETEKVLFHAGAGKIQNEDSNEIQVKWHDTNQNGTAGYNTITSGTYHKPDEGYKTFVGWYLDEALTEKCDYVDEETGLPTRELTKQLDLYAKYTYHTVTYVKSFTANTDKSQYNYKNYQVIEYDDFVSGENTVADGGETEPTAEEMGLTDGQTLGDWYIYDPEAGAIRTNADGSLMTLDLTQPLTEDYIVVGTMRKNLVKYAVQLYGIDVDLIDNDGTAGLTFGPATGKNYNTDSASHTPTENLTASGNPHLCIHDTSWEDIIYWASKDPYVFNECFDGYEDETGQTYSCTKTVQLSTSSRSTDTVLASGYSSGSAQIGDGAGELSSSLKSEYKKWNNETSNTGGWPASRVRATLNGAQTETADGTHNATSTVAGTDIASLTEEQSLIGAFPTELQHAIQTKKVKSDLIATDTLSDPAVTYDKLWLMSAAEIRYYDTTIVSNTNSLNNYGYLDDGYGYIRKNEGLDSSKSSTLFYERIRKIYANAKNTYSKLQSYTDGAIGSTGSGTLFFLRSVYKPYTTKTGVYAREDYVTSATNGSVLFPVDPVSTGYGIAPGFCIGER